MQKIAVVNDCAFVLHDLLPHLESNFDITYCTRTRAITQKTVGLLKNVSELDADLYHVNYGLQDAFLTSLLKRLDVLMIHGGEVRWTVRDRVWGWMVKYVLKKARHVLFSAPNIQSLVCGYREDAEHLPRPVNTNYFQPKQKYHNPTRALYFIQPYESFPKSIIQYFSEAGISLSLHRKRFPYEIMPKILADFDVYIDHFSLPGISKTCLEAMSCGLATVSSQDCRDLQNRLSELSDKKTVKREGEKNRKYVVERHASEKIASKLAKVWRSLLD